MEAAGMEAGGAGIDSGGGAGLLWAGWEGAGMEAGGAIGWVTVTVTTLVTHSDSWGAGMLGLGASGVGLGASGVGLGASGVGLGVSEGFVLVAAGGVAAG